jgi:hypothetical protein
MSGDGDVVLNTEAGESIPVSDVEGDVGFAYQELEEKESGIAPPPQPYEGQPRDEQGRWTVEQQQAEQQAYNQQGYAAPPPGWPPAAKAEYIKLAQTYPDHPIVQAVQQREAEMNAGMQMYSGLKPWIEQAQQAGRTLPEVIQNWAQAENLLATNFYDGVTWLCNYFGVNPEQLIAQYYGQPQQQQQMDPTTRYMQQLEQRINGLYQQQEQAQMGAINQELQQFASTHPYFENVEPVMAEVFKYVRGQGGNIGLDEAYDIAMWGHPDTRQIKIDELMQQQFGGRGQSNGNGHQPPPQSERGRSLSPGSPTPGVSSARKPKATVVDEVASLYDELSGV